jgi:hypothetical protein
MWFTLVERPTYQSWVDLLLQSFYTERLCGFKPLGTHPPTHQYIVLCRSLHSNNSNLGATETQSQLRSVYDKSITNTVYKFLNFSHFNWSEAFFYCKSSWSKLDQAHWHAKCLWSNEIQNTHC